MGRPKEFDRDDALRAAAHVFWRQGYAATTATDLIRAMGIGRQSFYDTFGDKHRCYLEALRRYARDRVGPQFDSARVAAAAAAAEAAAQAGRAPPDTASPLETLRAFLRFVTEQPDERRLLGCLVVNALAEGGDDPDVVAALGPSSQRLRQGIVDLLTAARDAGEVAPALDVEQAAHALLLTRMGIMLSAKAGHPPAFLRGVADFAVDQLRAPAPPTRRVPRRRGSRA